MPGNRIRVYVRFKDLKPVVDFVFETEGQLQQYQRVTTALGVKRIVSVDPRSRSIRVEVPPRAREVESSRSLNGFILHFERESEASAWIDPICRPVPNCPKVVVIQQYWDQGDLGEVLRAADEKYARRAPNLVADRRQRALTPPKKWFPYGRGPE
ncbi:hypothetical protein B0H66DRAFT_563768 [Apodospora peruviana]|uniref:Uncharacterized protein n=1 Tax=Apodospora peruviana TaxID=516989 RepID=A0AAE0M1Q4_9PEZI|nr:hypothetical protein B0H66DRAFT_563768 [Apodospora peruviana]